MESKLTLIAYQGDQRLRTTFMIVLVSVCALVFLNVALKMINETLSDLVSAFFLIGMLVYIILNYRSTGKKANGFIYLNDSEISSKFGDVITVLPIREIGHLFLSFQTNYPGVRGGVLLLWFSPSETLNFLRILHKGEYYKYTINLPEDMRTQIMDIFHQYRLSGMQVDIDEGLIHL